jgi:hypothetical protein
VTGLVGWLVIPAVSRAAGESLAQSGHLVLTGILGGLFLGMVEGMMEESTVKTVRGGVLGVFGGALGGLLGAWMIKKWGTDIGMQAVVLTWAVAGGSIGAVAGWLERKASRLGVGVVAGVLGGAMGGWLGYQMFASLSDIIRPELWGSKRIIEGLTGAILGGHLWLAIGLAEKLYIFKRRPLGAADHKGCDRCQTKNPLAAWYCNACGAVLQVAAAPDQLNLPKNIALSRLVSACQFLGRLSATAGTVVAVVSAILLGTLNVFLAVLGLLVIALIGYIGYILFNATAELLSTLLKRPN